VRFLIVLALAVPALFAEAFTFKVVVATVHGEWLHDMPTIGYWPEVKVSLAVSLLTVVCAFMHGIAKGVMDDDR
jgi:hypothetical protein